MKRRDLLKGAVALPMVSATALYGGLCGKASCPTPTMGTIQMRIILDGPFSVVLQTASSASDDINGVVAFTPVDPMEAHLFNLNGVPMPGKHHKFSNLKISNFTPTKNPCITGFDDFCTDHTPWVSSPTKQFITLVLPTPNRILTTRPTIPVNIGAQAKSLPQNHVLEYDVKPQSTISMDYREGGRIVSPVANTYIFEVGLDPQIDPDTDCSHAQDFYNNYTLPFFPALKGNVIQQFNTCPAFKGHTYSATFRTDKDRESYVQILTTTLECKSGGLIVTSP